MKTKTIRKQKKPILVVTNDRWSQIPYIVFEDDQIIDELIPSEWIDELFEKTSEEIAESNENARENGEREDKLPTRDEIADDMESDFLSENSDVDEYRDKHLRCDTAVYKYDNDGTCKYLGKYDSLDDFFAEQTEEKN